MLPPEEVSQRFAAEVAANQVRGLRERHRVVGGNDQLATASPSGSAIGCGWARRCRRSIADRGAVTLADGAVLAGRRSGGGRAAAGAVAAVGRHAAQLGAVGYGIGGKISVQFSRRIWLDYSRNGTVLSERAWGHCGRPPTTSPATPACSPICSSSHDGARSCRCPEAPDRVVQRDRSHLPRSAWAWPANGCTPTGPTIRTASARTHASGRPVAGGAGRRCMRRTAACGWPASTPTVRRVHGGRAAQRRQNRCPHHRPDYRRRDAPARPSVRSRLRRRSSLLAACGSDELRRSARHGSVPTLPSPTTVRAHDDCATTHPRPCRDHRLPRSRPVTSAARRTRSTHPTPSSARRSRWRSTPACTAVTGADGSYEIEVPGRRAGHALHRGTRVITASTCRRSRSTRRTTASKWTV